MKRILITGMSGTGKSSVTELLASRGLRAVDLDCDAWSHWMPVDGNPTGANPGHDWMWKQDAVEALLADAATDLFVSGCAPNMSRFYPQLDEIVLLSAPPDTLLERIASRSNNDYGKRADERRRVLENLRAVEPLLRRHATREIDARASLDAIAQALERLL